MTSGCCPARNLVARHRAGATTWARPLLGLLSPGGARGRLTVLIFHRVRVSPDELFPNELHAASFRERMAWVAALFNVIPLADAVSALAKGSLPRRALAITFDDGYADNYTVALPILRELNLHATFFVASGFLDGGRMWNDTVIEAIRGTRAGELDFSAIGLDRIDVASRDAKTRAIGRLLPALKYLASDERQTRVDAIAALAGVALPQDLMMSSDQLRALASSGMGIGAHTVSHRFSPASATPLRDARSRTGATRSKRGSASR